MRRNRQLLFLVLGLLGVAFLLLLLLAGIALQRRHAQLETPTVAAVSHDAAVEPQDEAPRDPWDGREEEAIERVRSWSVDGESLGERVADGALTRVWSNGERWGASASTWVAERDSERGEGNHIVRLLLPVEGLTWGPRWRVDLASDAPPEPEEALAMALMDASRASLERRYNRADEVVTALTHHRFGGAYRLGGALLVQLRTDSALDLERALGWVVAPEVVEPEGGALVYLAAFRWRAGDTVRAAIWDIDLQNRQFRPRNLLANQVMSRAQRVVDMDIRPLELPRTGASRAPMDLTVPPERERTPMIRALRFVVSDERIREAVAMLLAVEENGEIVHRGWRADPGDGPRHFFIAYVIERDGEEERIQWGVDADRGVVEPISPMALLAQRVLGGALEVE